MITPKNFKFCIECKKGYNKENLYSLYNNSSDFWGFIKQSEKDSEKSKKLPLVIFKQDRQPILAVVPFNIEFPSIPKISIHYEDKKYNIYLFDDIISFDSSYWFC